LLPRNNNPGAATHTCVVPTAREGVVCTCACVLRVSWLRVQGAVFAAVSRPQCVAGTKARAVCLGEPLLALGQ
jgi:hypothetical protein